MSVLSTKHAWLVFAEERKKEKMEGRKEEWKEEKKGKGKTAEFADLAMVMNYLVDAGPLEQQEMLSITMLSSKAPVLWFLRQGLALKLCLSVFISQVLMLQAV